MNLSRRNLAKSTSALGVLAALGACGIITDTNGTITVNLATVQAQANAFYDAIVDEAPVVTSFSAALGTSLAKALPDLKTAVAVFTALPASTTLNSASSDIQAILKVADVILPIVSPALGALTVAALNASYTIFASYFAGSTTVTLPASVIKPQAELGFKATKVIAAPVPIPLT